MPAGEPVLGSSSGNRQLLGNNLKDSNASMRHARDCQATPGQARTGDRRSGTRSARASATNAGLGETHVPTHEGPITWDICRELRHRRRGGDSNPRWTESPYRFSRPAHSTALPPLQGTSATKSSGSGGPKTSPMMSFTPRLR